MTEAPSRLNKSDSSARRLQPALLPRHGGEKSVKSPCFSWWASPSRTPLICHSSCFNKLSFAANLTSLAGASILRLHEATILVHTRPQILPRRQPRTSTVTGETTSWEVDSVVQHPGDGSQVGSPSGASRAFPRLRDPVSSLLVTPRGPHTADRGCLQNLLLNPHESSLDSFYPLKENFISLPRVRKRNHSLPSRYLCGTGNVQPRGTLGDQPPHSHPDTFPVCLRLPCLS